MCAPYIAAPRVRVSRDGGRTYPRGTERPVTHQLPSQPAAVRVYDADGTTRCLVADFDVKKCGRLEQVERDAAAFVELVRRCGGRVLEDGSPSGGRHVYVPLAVPIPWGLARRIAQALEALYPSFDKAPMAGATDGLIRPPGSPHPAGGWQVLLTPRDEAISALSSRTPPPAFERLARAVGVDPDADAVVPPSPTRSDAWLQAVSTGPLWGRQRRPLPLEWQLMATQGIRPRQWPSDSEARLALLRACARHGWVFRDVVARYESGEWPAFRALYERYSPANARAALAKDWLKASSPEHLKAGPPDAEEGSAHRSDTSPVLTHPRTSHTDDEGAKVRTWWTVVRSLERYRWQGRQGLSIRRVLRAIAAAAQNTGSTVVSFGVRSLAEGSGLSHETVAQVLRELREEGDPVLVRVVEAEGMAADTYELRVPKAHESLEALRWRRGRIRPVHPLFRALGGAAFLVWEAVLEAGQAPASALDIAAESCVPLRTVDQALRELGELGLVEKRAGGWVAIGSLDEAAVAVGADEVHARIMGEHRRARRAWQALCRRLRSLRELRHAVEADRWWLREEPPPRDDPAWDFEHGGLAVAGA